MKKLLPLFLIGLILSSGIFVRLWSLDSQFTHIDDIGVAKTIIDYERAGSPGSFTGVARFWTYAPFQFWITPFFIHPGQSYREFLFWGRLPSVLFSVLGLVLLAVFYRRYDGWKSGRVFTALALAAFAWENVIHARQMHNYALGVTALTAVMILLLAGTKKKAAADFLFTVPAGLVLGLFCWMQYQVLFFVPAFFGTLFFFGWRRLSRPRLLAALGAGAAAFAAVFYPLWTRYLRKHEDAGVGWNAGRAGEFLLSFPAGASLADKVREGTAFFVKNLLIVFENTTAFLSPEHPLQGFFYYVLGVLFLLGIASYFMGADENKRIIGLFFGLGFLTWAGLVVLQKITLSPTRHSLILLPLMAVVTAEGVFVPFRLLAADRPGIFPEREKTVSAVLAAVILFFSLADYPAFLRLRQDPFREDRIVSSLKEFGVETLFRVNHTIHPVLMQGVTGYLQDYEGAWATYGVLNRPGGGLETIGWISHRDPLSPEAFERLKREVNPYILFRNQSRARSGQPRIPLLTTSLSDYEIVFSEEVDSSVQVDYSSLTENGPNAYYFYILRRKN